MNRRGFFFSGRRRHTRCALVTGVQTCALPISACCPFGIDRAIELEEVARARIPTPAVHPRDQLHRGRVDMEPVTIDKLVADMEAENLGDHDGRRLGFDRLEQIGSASCRAECVRTCRSRWSPYH